MSHPEVEAILGELQAKTTGPGRPIEQIRSEFEKLYSQFKTTQPYKQEKVHIGNLTGSWIQAPHVQDKGCILFFHGGGFSIGSVKSHADFCARISAAASLKVLAMHYRLTPENPFPAALDDCFSVYQWLLKHQKPSEIALAGISAGASLVLSTLLKIKEQKLDLPQTAVCLSPFVDFLCTAPSIDENKGKDWIERDRLEAVRELYLGEHDPKDPLASPIYGDLTGFPPLLIQAGQNEILRDDARHFAEKAEKQGVEVTLEIWEGMIHCWQVFASKIPEGHQAVAKIGEFLKSKMGAYGK